MYTVCNLPAKNLGRRARDEKDSVGRDRRPGGRPVGVPDVRQRDGRQIVTEKGGRGYRDGGRDLRPHDGPRRSEGAETGRSCGSRGEVLRVPRRDPGAEKGREAREGCLLYTSPSPRD